MDDSSATPAALPTTYHIIGDSYVDYICRLAASSSLPSVGEDVILPYPMTARAGGSPINTATHLTTLLLQQQQQQQQQQLCREDDNDDDNRCFAGEKGTALSAAIPGWKISIQTCFNPHDAMGRILMDHADAFQLVLVNDWLLVKNNNDNNGKDGDGDHRSNSSSNNTNNNTSTPHCIVMVTGSDRSFLTHRGCGVGWDVTTTFGPTPDDHCGYLHIAGYYCTPEFATEQRLAKLLRQWRQQQRQNDIGRTTIISLVTQYDASGQWDGGLVDDVIPLLDILIMNEVEATSVMEAYQKRKYSVAATVFDNDKSIGRDDDPTDRGNSMIGKWQQFYDQRDVIVVVTMGERGAIVFRNGAIEAHMAPPAIDAVTDTTGAGDAFAAGFLYGHQISHGGNNSIESALAWGCAMGSASVSVVGASVPVDRSLIEHQRANLIQRLL
jgi:sugar/nucleoside kinase (ribokinase family)